MTSLGLKIIIKMSSVLNVSNDRSKSEEFNLNNTEMIVDSEEQNWFKWTHVGKFLGLLIRQWRAWISVKCLLEMA